MATKGILKFARLHKDAIVPKYMTTGAACFDIFALEDDIIPPESVIVIRTGLAVQIEDGYEMQIRPRSSIAKVFPNYIANEPGTIDSDYRGELKILIVNNINDSYLKIKKGDRICQGKIAKVYRPNIIVVDFLDDTERGYGGLGSTGR